MPTLSPKKDSRRSPAPPGIGFFSHLTSSCRLVIEVDSSGPPFLQAPDSRFVRYLKLGEAGTQHVPDLVDQYVARGTECPPVAMTRAQQPGLGVAAAVAIGGKAK